MFLLLIFLYLKSGAIEARTSIVYNTSGKAEQTCNEALPLTVSLYERGKFHDGPKKELLKKVTGRCEPVEEDNKIAYEDKSPLVTLPENPEPIKAPWNPEYPSWYYGKCLDTKGNYTLNCQ